MPGGRTEKAPDPAPSVRWVGGGSSGGAILLGFLAWVWVLLPAIKTDPKTKAPGGLAASKRVLAAKFLNRTS